MRRTLYNRDVPTRPAFTAGNYYHLYNRGANRAAIFRERDNYVYVLHKVKQAVLDNHLTIIAYCLLPNHYHFLVRQDAELAAGHLAQEVFNGYSKAYNKRYGHSGTLFEGPYRVNLVDSQRYLLHLCRYIHANPVRHGLVGCLSEWPYSNYPEWTGTRQGELVDRQFIRDCFGSGEAYAQFVGDYLENRKLPAGLVRMLQELEA